MLLNEPRLSPCRPLSGTRSLRASAWLVAFLVAWAPAIAQAKPRPGEKAARKDFRSGTYVAVSPGLVHVPMGDDAVDDLHELGYLWGVGAGVVRPLGPIRFGFGVGFEHAIYDFDDDLLAGCGVPGGACSLGGSMLRFNLQLRLGVGGRRIFVYGLVGPSFSLSLQNAQGRLGPLSAEESDVDPGLGTEVGVGLQVRVFRSLAIGFEPGVDFAFMFNHDEPGDDTYGFHTLDFELFAAWYF